MQVARPWNPPAGPLGRLSSASAARAARARESTPFDEQVAEALAMPATQQMQLLINALFGIASPHMLVVGMVDKKFDAEGNLIDENFQKIIDVFVREFLWLAESLHPETVLN